MKEKNILSNAIWIFIVLFVLVCALALFPIIHIKYGINIAFTYMHMLAVVVIAFLAGATFSRDNEFRETIQDLFQAIVLSNLLSSDSGKEERKKLFFEVYNGKTKIPSW